MTTRSNCSAVGTTSSGRGVATPLPGLRCHGSAVRRCVRSGVTRRRELPADLLVAPAVQAARGCCPRHRTRRTSGRTAASPRSSRHRMGRRRSRRPRSGATRRPGTTRRNSAVPSGSSTPPSSSTTTAVSSSSSNSSTVTVRSPMRTGAPIGRRRWRVLLPAMRSSCTTPAIRISRPHPTARSSRVRVRTRRRIRVDAGAQAAAATYARRGESWRALAMALVVGAAACCIR